MKSIYLVKKSSLFENKGKINKFSPMSHLLKYWSYMSCISPQNVLLLMSKGHFISGAMDYASLDICNTIMV